MTLRTRRRRLIFGGIFDQFDHCDRLSGIISDLPEIERGRMPVDDSVAAQGVTVEYALELFLGNFRVVAERRCDPDERLAIVAIFGPFYTEALLRDVLELVAEGNADIGDGDAFSLAHGL